MNYLDWLEEKFVLIGTIVIVATNVAFILLPIWI